MTDVQEKAVDISKETNMIWTIANRLRGAYKADKYRDTIIPMTIIRRFECALAETKSKVVEQFKKNDKTPRQILERLSGYKFYCTSEFTLDQSLHQWLFSKYSRYYQQSKVHASN